MNKIIAVPAPEPKKKYIKVVGVIASILALSTLVLHFISIVGTANHAGEHFWRVLQNSIWLYAPTIFVTVFAVPFMIGLKASKLMQKMSFIMTIILAFSGLTYVYAYISQLAVTVFSGFDNVAPFAAGFSLAELSLFVNSVTGALATWVLWGRWPYGEKTPTAKKSTTKSRAKKSSKK
jgi:hypothetical protein